MSKESVDFFSETPDHVILDIFLYTLGDVSVPCVRAVVAFGGTCRRMRKLYQTRDVWRNIDLARFLHGKSDGLLVSRLVQLPQVSFCEQFCTRICNVPSAFIVCLIKSMPRLRALAVSLGGSEASYIAPPQCFSMPQGRQVAAGHVIEAIESLHELEELAILVESPRNLVPICFPPKLRKLSVVSNIASGSSGMLFEAPDGPFPRIEALSISSADISSAISACPGVTSLTVSSTKASHPLTPNDVRSILLGCSYLRELEIRHHFPRQRLELPDLGDAPCSNLLTRVSWNSWSDDCPAKALSMNCPSIVELVLVNPPISPKDVATLSRLKRLEVLVVNCGKSRQRKSETDIDDYDDGGGDEIQRSVEFSGAFSTLGESSGALFRKLELIDAKFDAEPFFTARRCLALKELRFTRCEFSESAMTALSLVVADSLRLFHCEADGDWFVPLLVNCKRLENLVLDVTSTDVLKLVGSATAAPLLTVDLSARHGITDIGLEAIQPALKNVVDLTISGTSESLTSKGISRTVATCKYLQKLCVVNDIILYSLRSLISPSIDLTLL